MDRFATCWEGLEDPRTNNARLHDFHELLFIALCAVLRGGQNAVDLARDNQGEGRIASSRLSRNTKSRPAMH